MYNSKFCKSRALWDGKVVVGVFPACSLCLLHFLSATTHLTQHMFAASLWVLLGQLWLLKTQLASCSLGTTWPLYLQLPHLSLPVCSFQTDLWNPLCTKTSWSAWLWKVVASVLLSQHQSQPQTWSSVCALVSGPNWLSWSPFYWVFKWVLAKLEPKPCRFSSCFLCNLT